MNKAAPKEPSMDEILSSIRQIIADDDAAVAPPRPPIQASQASRADPMAATPVNFDMDDLPSFKPQGEPAGGRFPIVPKPVAPPAAPKTSLADVLGTISAAEQKAATQPEPEDEPFALSAMHIIGDDADEDEAPAAEPFSFASILADTDAPPVRSLLVDPEDVSFAPEPEAPLDFSSFLANEPEQAPEPVFEPARPSARVADTSPMPDARLSADMAEQLIEPTTSAAVRHTFSKLSGMNLANQGMTIEGMLKDMLRPMLKEWLDENLPSVVERIVEKEISRISRGLD